MEAVARSAAPARSREASFFQPAAIAAWALGFLPVLYLALRGGGYDPVIRNEVGIAVWWIVLIGVVVGLLPAIRVRPAGWIALGCLAAFAGWTALAGGWSESNERTYAELTRLATYLGVFALALVVQGRGTAKHAVAGVASAIGMVGLLAVLSRLHPAWFPENELAEFFPGSPRLDYPFNSSNTLGPFVAMGVPLMVVLATSARTLAGQALAAAAIPVLGLAVFLTASRGGVLAAIVGALVLLALVPQRLPRLASGALGGLGALLLISAVEQRDALQMGLGTATAHSQGDEVLVLLVIVCLGVALVQVALGLATRYRWTPEWIAVSREASRGVVVLVAAAAVIAFAAFAASGELSQRWNEFRNPLGASQAGQENVSGRLRSFSGTGRYQYWAAAVEAGRSEPLHGIGPGTFEFSWLRSPHYFEYARNAHSLYFETFAETGVIGLLLLLGFLGVVVGAGAQRAFIGPGRAWVAAATAACSAFLAGAAFEWTWQIPAAAFAFLVLAAAVVSRGAAARRTRERRARVVLGALAVLAIPVLAIHLAGTSALRDSQARARSGDVAGALEKAHLAADIQPYAAGPRLQEALLLEQSGDLRGAGRAIARATADEPTNWRLWLIRSRIDARLGRASLAVADYRRANRLYPKGSLTARPS